VAVAAMLAAGASLFAAAAAEAKRPERPVIGRARTRLAAPRNAFRLFQGSPSTSIEVNRVYCGLTDAGNVCTDVTGSPVLGGGSWPRGTPDQYIFNTGVQVAGVIPADAGFAWAGDTVGAWAIDTRGPAEHMQTLTTIFSSLNADDLANWPDQAVVRDTSLYDSSLVGRSAISQQDTWVRYWDGNPSFTTGRGHTMGLMVEQRSLAWNFPVGNEDLVYFLFRFTNITSRNVADYQGLAALGYSAADIQAIADLGAQFQSASEAAFNVDIPDGGYAIENAFAAFVADMDVGDAGNNYGSAILPFSLGITYKSDFQESAWQFPGNIFRPPFAVAPGFVGVKYLKSPIDPLTGDEFGMSMFSTYTNPSSPNSPFPDPINIFQGYRYISGTAGPASGDNACGIPNPQQRRLCFLAQTPADARTFQSSGPFTLAPGQSEVIVVAYLFAPAVASMGSGTCGGTGSCPYDITPFLGGDMQPGIVPSGERLVLGLDTLRNFDRAVGWVTHSDADGDGEIRQDEVTVVRGSLLDKSLVAQAVFDNKFLLPFAPEAPTYYLIPGDNQVTVVWERSVTDDPTGPGDPYFAVASNVASPLYDPNFRQYDVEGYRVWKGRSPATLELVAQFDYDNTVITDFTGQFYNADYGLQCAPELGITASCPAFPHDIPLADLGLFQPGVVQVLPGDRVEKADGNVLITRADTAVNGGGSGFPPLQDTGVPFVYIDNDVRNGFRYFYAVTAFDVNSLASGPSSLQSALITRAVTPRATAANQIPAGEFILALLDQDGEPLDLNAPNPIIDPVTGTFSGPAAPTTNLEVIGLVFADQLVVGNQLLELTIDSIVPRWYHEAQYFVTVTVNTGSGPQTSQSTFGYSGPLGEEDGNVLYELNASLTADPDLAAQAGLSGLPYAGQATVRLTQGAATFFSKDADWHLDVSGSFFAPMSPSISIFGGSRWFDGANETMADPTAGTAHGSLTGVTAIYRPVRNRNADALIRRLDQTSYHLFRAADIEVHWGATPGTVDSVIDVTHNVPVPFDPQYRASWGFLSDFVGTTVGSPSAPNGVLSYHDFLQGPCLVGAAGIDNTGCDTRDLTSTATLMDVDTTADGTVDGQGFAMYINGEPFIFILSAPATLPSNTAWTLRTYAGAVRRTSGGVYSFVNKPRPPNVTGLRAQAATTTPATYPTNTQVNLNRVHTVPDPYYVTSSFEFSGNSKVLRFVNLPTQCIIRIYSTSGILVNVLTHNDPGGGGEEVWNLRNRNNQFVASGVYFYHIETPAGQTRVGRFTVVNFAQ
jgi:hypothetical protein